MHKLSKRDKELIEKRCLDSVELSELVYGDDYDEEFDGKEDVIEWLYAKAMEEVDYLYIPKTRADEHDYGHVAYHAGEAAAYLELLRTACSYLCRVEEAKK